MILPGTLSAGHAWLCKRCGRSKTVTWSQEPGGMFKTKNDLTDEIRAAKDDVQPDV
jgi:hypothetical protein